MKLNTKCENKLSKPYLDGSVGQFLVKSYNDENIWSSMAAISENEYVITQLSIDASDGVPTNVSVYVDIEGGESSTYITDSSGICRFYVPGGAIYNVTPADISNYITPASLSFRGTWSSRLINFVYYETSKVEHVVVDLTYTGTDASRASSLNVIYDDQTHTYAIVDNRCEFDVAFGTSYRIEFESLEQYATPSKLTYTASLYTRSVRATYLYVSANMYWVKTDGTFIDFGEVTAADKSSLAGLYIATSELITARAPYIIRIDHLLGETSIDSSSWCTTYTLFNSINCYTSVSTALTDDGTNFSGESNTTNIIEEAATVGVVVPAFTICNNATITIGSVTKNGFLGSLAQIKVFSNNRDSINSWCYKVFGKNCININSGSWWSSTQYSQSSAWYLTNGSPHYGYGKTGSFHVLPFFAL